jgi:cytidine deaminase
MTLEETLADSDRSRLSVSLMDVNDGHETEFLALASDFAALLSRKDYGRAEMIRDEAAPQRFYAVRHWTGVAAAEQWHRDADAQALTSKLYKIARVTHVVNGVRRREALPRLIDDQRARAEADRRSGFDPRVKDVGRPPGDRRSARDRRRGPRRVRARPGEVDLVGAARRARENADAAFSHFAVGAALETVDGDVLTGCNIESATYGLTMCAERVAMFKALSEGHRAFIRIAIVADTESPTPPCGACRQVLWEFGGNLEIVLANMVQEQGTHRLRDLLPLPFDARALVQNRVSA